MKQSDLNEIRNILTERKQYKMMQVFDSQEMPKYIREEVFRIYHGKRNGVYVDFGLEDAKKDASGLIPELRPLALGLMANGAKLDTKVLIHYGW